MLIWWIEPMDTWSLPIVRRVILECLWPAKWVQSSTLFCNLTNCKSINNNNFGAKIFRCENWNYRWWCHFDDDNYVHVARLSQLLLSQRSDRPVYLGKPSTARPIDIWDLHNPKVRRWWWCCIVSTVTKPSRANFHFSPQNVSQFWFATGGAGFCISRTMALKMAPFAA